MSFTRTSFLSLLKSIKLILRKEVKRDPQFFFKLQGGFRERTSNFSVLPSLSISKAYKKITDKWH